MSFRLFCRAALESDYVSANLHQWIDLIFGCKQVGQSAEKACNLFHFLTYAGAVNIDKISSPDNRFAYEQQIRDFGQTPQQLFTSPHPMRRVRPPNIVDTTEETLRLSALNLAPNKTSPIKVDGQPPAQTTVATVAAVLEVGGCVVLDAAHGESVDGAAHHVPVIHIAPAVEVTEGSTDVPTTAAACQVASELSESATLALPIPVNKRSRSVESQASDGNSSAAETTQSSSSAQAQAQLGHQLVSSNNQLQKLNITKLIPATGAHVCVVTMSDLLLQSAGMRPLLTKNVTDKLFDINFVSNRKQQLMNHRAVGSIACNLTTTAFEGAYNVNCVRIPSLTAFSSHSHASSSESVLVIGYLDASLKVVTVSEGEWNVVCSFDCDNHSFTTAASMSEDDELLVVTTYPLAGIQLWRRSPNNHTVFVAAPLASSQYGLGARSKSASAHTAHMSQLGKSERVLSPLMDAHSQTHDAFTQTRYRYFPYLLSETLSAYAFHGSAVITAVKVSTKFDILVTACSYGVVALWDLDTLRGMRLVLFDYFTRSNEPANPMLGRLPPVRGDKVWCVDIDSINGDVYVAIGGTIHIFDINGRLRIAVDIASHFAHGSGGGIQPNDASNVNGINVLCVQPCPVVEWAKHRGFVVGCSNGSVMLWSFGFNHHKQQPTRKSLPRPISATAIPVANAAAPSPRPRQGSQAESETSEDAKTPPAAHSYYVSDEGLVANLVFHIEETFGSAAVTALRITNDMKTLYAGSEEGTVSKWDLVYK
jgi:hypothetical protein